MSRIMNTARTCRIAALAIGFVFVGTLPGNAQGRNPSSLEMARHYITRRSPNGHGMGYVPTEDAQFAASPHFKVAPQKRGLRPEQVILTDFLPPVGNQRSQGSCVAWSTAYYNYTYAVAKERKLTQEDLATPKWQFSPAFIYNQGKGFHSGMTLSKAFEILQTQGCATLAEMAYDANDDKTLPSDAAKARAARYIPRSIGYVFRYKQADPDAIKTFLAETRQPFTTAIPIYADFPEGKVDPGFVYTLTVDPIPKNFHGGHAITIVGYDDTKKAFRMVNSWGPDWGDAGFMWISEDFIQKYALEGWAEVPGGPSVRTVIRAPYHVTPDVMLEPAAKK